MRTTLSPQHRTTGVRADAPTAAEPDLTADQPSQTVLGIVPARVLQVLLSIIAALVLLGLLLPSHPFWLGRESATLGLLAARVDLDGEGNLPSYFSALQRLACGIALYLFTLLQLAALERRQLQLVMRD